ncbi:hypothetical protein HYALB_00008725 [Hymenoscyphus albidus]|uniref:Uncharacterized protein n=1 Tax=Hymenoscyphus albidus TaxID=595503 RepID=A0A9N9LSC7_9HELO|nr:hypothetical protein HYALB_00008725 [Hymenoscyphus albidus]
MEEGILAVRYVEERGLIQEQAAAEVKEAVAAACVTQLTRRMKNSPSLMLSLLLTLRPQISNIPSPSRYHRHYVKLHQQIVHLLFLVRLEFLSHFLAYFWLASRDTD